MAAQDSITGKLEELERTLTPHSPPGSTLKAPAVFREDQWKSESRVLKEGGGRSRVLEGGRVFERAGVNFSDVSGEFSEEMAKSMPGFQGTGRDFRAAGISLVLHPESPRIPTVHANFRVIRRGQSLWFGGGADITPYSLVKDDIRHFHSVWKDLCARHPSVADHQKFKKTCDEYFYLPHRAECRGAGGIFYDYLMEKPDELLRFSKDGAASFLPAYVPIVEKRAADPYGDHERRFQLYRRGRYVEFNLLYDRGTVFGMKTGGRAESILMSLPPLVRWEYDYHAPPGSPEEELLSILKHPVAWI